MVGERALEVFVDVGDRTAQVYGTAARIANPDKRLSHGYTHWGRLPVTTFTMRGEPRRAGPSDGTTEYKIVEGLFGTVQAPLLDGPSGSLADAIDSVEAEPGDGRARATLDGLPPTLVAVGVVEFAHPMTTEQLVAATGSAAATTSPTSTRSPSTTTPTTRPPLTRSYGTTA